MKRFTSEQRALQSLKWFLRHYQETTSLYLANYYLTQADLAAKYLAKHREFHNDCK